MKEWKSKQNFFRLRHGLFDHWIRFGEERKKEEDEEFMLLRVDGDLIYIARVAGRPPVQKIKVDSNHKKNGKKKLVFL